MKLLQLVCAVLSAIAALVLCPSAAQGASVNRKLPNFAKIRYCAPFSALITPGNSPSFSLDADQSVIDALSTSVDSGGSLKVGTKQNFQSTRPIKLTITVPASKFRGITVNNPAIAQVAVSPGFTARTFAASISGAGKLILQGLNVDTLTLNSNGVGQLYVKGRVARASVTANGVSKTYIGGGNIGEVTVNVGNVGQVIVDSTNAKTKIGGTAQQLGKISYTSGTCTISGGSIPGFSTNSAASVLDDFLKKSSPCKKVATSPLKIPKFTSSCGLRVKGKFDCSGGGSSSSSSASTSGNGGGVISQQASSSGGSSSISQTASINGATTSSSTGSGAVATALPCSKT